MHTQGPECVPRPRNRPQLVLHPDIPQFDLPIAAGTNQFPHAPTLHVYVGNPLLMTTVAFDHRVDGFLALIIDLDFAIAEASDEDVSGDLVGG